MFKKITILFLLIILIYVCFSNCSDGTTGKVKCSTIINGKNYYEVFRQGITASSSVFYLLCIIPTDEDSIYNSALTQLQKQVPSNEYSLINISADYTTDVYILFSIRKVTLTADIVKYPLSKRQSTGAIKNIPPKGMVYIPAGLFIIGGKRGDKDEEPEKRTSIKHFFLDMFELTVGEYYDYCTDNKIEPPEQPIWSRYDSPVVNVNYKEAKNYCEKIGKRLPTEEEWEYAAGGREHSYWSNGFEFEATNYCYNRSIELGACAVGSYPPNTYGLYDMSGNVWEWTDTWYYDGYLSSKEKKKYIFSEKEKEKVVRSGAWNLDDQLLLRVSNRNSLVLSERNSTLGLRCAKSIN